MYLTDILAAKDLDGTLPEDVPEQYIKEQFKRMEELLKMVRILEQAHRDAFGPNITFAPGFIMYLDYIIHRNTSGTVQ